MGVYIMGIDVGVGVLSQKVIPLVLILLKKGRNKMDVDKVLEWVRDCNNPYELNEVWECLKSRMY